MKNHTTHFDGYECEKELIKDLMEWLESFHDYDEENGGCKCCKVLARAKERLK